MSTRKDTKGFLLGAIAGGIVGSITALLFAPKAGKELRHDISAGAQKVGDTTLKAASKVGETTGRIVKDIGDGAANIAGNVVSSIKGIRRSDDSAAIATISGIASENLIQDNLTQENSIQDDLIEDAIESLKDAKEDISSGQQ